MPSRLPAWSGSSESYLKLSSDQISSSIGPSSGIQGKPPDGACDPAPKGAPAGGTSNSSSGSLAGPVLVGGLRGTSAELSPDVSKAGAREEVPAVGVASASPGDDASKGMSTSTTGRLPLSATGDSRGGAIRPGASPGSEDRKSPKSSSASNTSYPRLSIEIKTY